jgi:hypothetical protein
MSINTQIRKEKEKKILNKNNNNANKKVLTLNPALLTA